MKSTLSVILAIAATTIASSAYACTCLGLPKTAIDARIYIERSDLVALVYVAEHSHRAWVENDIRKHDAFARTIVRRSFKGLPANSEVYFDLGSASTCAPRFQLQHTYLVFATGPGPDGRFSTTMCSMGQIRADIDEAGYEEHNKLLQSIIAPTIDAIERALE